MFDDKKSSSGGNTKKSERGQKTPLIQVSLKLNKTSDV